MRGPDWRSQLRTAQVGAAALLPIRFFFGATFLFAGLDKFFNPSFLGTEGAASIGSQLALFARSSPIGGLVTLVLPIAPLIGFLIAVGEIAVGLGALTGLAFRLAAAGGAALSLLFFLTVSWSTRPFYYGPDLPYLMGWVVLALAGHGNLLVPHRFIAPIGDSGAARDGLPGAAGVGAGAAGLVPSDVRSGQTPPSPARRAFMQAGILGALAIIVAAAASPFRGIFGSTSGTGLTADGSGGSPGDTIAPSGEPGPTTAASGPLPTPAGSGPAASPGVANLAVGKVADVQSAGFVAFQVPADAPAPLPAGDPAVVLKLKNGNLVAYDLICTHQGCTIDNWDAANQVLICPCHGAEFDAASNGAVVAGPARTRLPSLPIVIDSATGTIYLKA